MSQETAPAAAARAAARLRRRPSSLTRAVAEALESRRLLAAPQVTPPPPPVSDGSSGFLSPDGHFDFNADAAPHKQKLLVGFDQAVTLAPGALSLTNLTTGAPYTDLTQAGPGTANDYTWTVAGQGDHNVTGALPRGNYELLVNDFAVTNAAGETLDGNTGIVTNDTVGGSGDDYVSRFHFQPGDANHDRLVTGDDYSSIDFGILFPGMNGYSNGDFNYDGVVTQADYDIIDAWYGTALPAPPSEANELVAAAGQGFIDLTWTPPQTDANGNAIGVDGYKIYRSLDAGDTWTLHYTLPDPAATHWQDTGLADGTKYTYRVRPYNADGAGVTTNKYWTVTNLPGPGSEPPVVSDVTHDALTLTWNDNTSNESGFRIEVTGPGGATSVIPVSARAGKGQTSFRVEGLSPETSYSFRVRAYITGTQESAWSPNVAATTLAVGDPQAPVVVAPTGLTATLKDDTGVILSWTDNSSDELDFLVERSFDGITFSPWQTAGPDATTYTGSGLSPSTQYYFRVRAQNDYGQSGPSNVAGITTLAFAGPSNLVATAHDGNTIRLTWQNNSHDGYMVDIWRKTGGDGQWGWYTYEAADAAGWIDPNVTAGQTYHYKVQARTPAGLYSEFSNEASAKAQQIVAPTGLAAQAVSTSEINLSWSDNSTGESGFEIQISPDDDASFFPLAVTPPNARHFSVTHLAADQTYFFRIRALKNGESDWSATASARTQDVPGDDGDEDAWLEDLGTVKPDVMQENTKWFGQDFEPGTYRVVWASGATYYGYSIWGSGHDASYSVVNAGLELPVVERSTQAEAEASGIGTFTAFEHGGGAIGVRFWDSNYGDNDPASGVTWKLQRYHAPEPPPTPEDLPNVTLSVNPQHATATEGGEDYIELVFSRGTGQPGKKRPAVDVYYTLAGTATPQEDYTGPTGGSGFGGVYKVTIPADSGSEDPTVLETDGVSATVEVTAETDDALETTESVFAAIRATGTYLFAGVLAQGEIQNPPELATITVADAHNVSNQVEVANFTDEKKLYVQVEPGALAHISLNADIGPVDADKSRVRWKITSNAANDGVPQQNEGDFASPPTLALSPEYAGGRYFITAGLDEDGDGTLQASEVQRTAEVHILSLDLTVDKSVLRLLQDNALSVLHEGAGVGTYAWEIRRANESQWHTITETAAPSWSGKARVAGRFKVRATTSLGGKSFSSAERDVIVEFPRYEDIVADSGFQQSADAAWQRTLQTATPDGRYEWGSWVILDTDLETYVTPTEADWTPGPMAPNDLTKADWLPPARPAEDTNPSPVSRPKYVVASFHTHSPWKFVDALGGIVASRPVGGHDADAAADKNENVVGIVYDYVGTPDEFSDKNQILEGHPLDAPAKLYHSPGTSRILP